jgi:hypothetical protein
MMPLTAFKRTLNSLRDHNRRTVILPAKVKVGNFEFKCTVFDLSLGGIRLKFDLPIEIGTQVLVKLKNKIVRIARVIWSADGFLGLSFTDDPEKVKTELGSLAIGLQ